MNTNQAIALTLSAVWFILALLTDDNTGLAMMLTTSNIWLAAALLAGGGAQMNRTQKRQQQAEMKRRRKLTANSKALAAYADRARLWAKGATLTGRHIGGELAGDWTFSPTVPHDKRQAVAEYATHTPLRWHIVAKCVCRTQTGEQYTVDADAECGQAQHVGELYDLREELMGQCRAQVNARHIWDELFEMRVL